ncbi:hypothetical protein Aglo03_29700 [Actinokineospora globicatena]|uniref:Extradiol ring-cleavage dioxygenase class III enzyme subunit B domain-containing protein n=1 Tax=Actinokineospora globicatena TaxID=103729 RepID=A0A9W6QPB6_9PSEU|nr:hypothetical protein Aglo03_29700 [Actinokineospora globicatena]
MTQPVLYLSHGAPPLADDVLWTKQLAAWSAELPKPKAVLIVSAHWEEAPLTIGATETVPLTYDFWGFPQRYYQVRYPAPGAPELAAQVRKLLRTPSTPSPTTRPAASTTARTSRWSRCSRTPTCRSCRSRCRPWTPPPWCRSAANSPRCATKAS